MSTYQEVAPALPGARKRREVTASTIGAARRIMSLGCFLIHSSMKSPNVGQTSCRRLDVAPCRTTEPGASLARISIGIVAQPEVEAPCAHASASQSRRGAYSILKPCAVHANRVQLRIAVSKPAAGRRGLQRITGSGRRKRRYPFIHPQLLHLVQKSLVVDLEQGSRLLPVPAG